MKIYRSVTIDMTTGETVAEDAVEYIGPLALCEETGEQENPHDPSDDPPGNDGPSSEEMTQQFLDAIDEATGTDLSQRITGMPGTEDYAAKVPWADRFWRGLKIFGRGFAKGFSDAAGWAILSVAIPTGWGLAGGVISLTDDQRQQAINAALEADPSLTQETAAAAVDATVSSANEAAANANAGAETSAESGSGSGSGSGWQLPGVDPAVPIAGGNTVAPTNSGALFNADPFGLNRYYSGAEGDVNAYIDQSKQNLAGFEQNTQDITDEWKAFGQTNGWEWNDVRGEYVNQADMQSQTMRGISSDFEADLAGIPRISATMPSSFGGATIPLAPGSKWQNYATNRANTRANLENMRYDNVLDSLSGRTQAASTFGQNIATGLGNRQNLNTNQLVAQTGANEMSLLPTQMAMELLKIDKAGSHGVSAAEANKPESHWYDSMIPALGNINYESIIKALT